jgi:peptidoglycan/LPS O-acetylase OafA/YrhL
VRPIDHYNNFDLIRLFAAMQVLYVHTAVHLQAPAFGWPAPYFIDAFPGVYIFFVISGFLVTRSFIESPGGVLHFFWRRALRIYPALWAHYVVIFAALALAGAFAMSTIVTPVFWKWVAGAFFIGSDFWGNVVAKNNLFDYSGFYKRFPSGVLWTINAELGFYLLVPLVFAPFLRRTGLVWIAVLIAFAGSFYVNGILTNWVRTAGHFTTTGMLSNSPFPYFWMFLLGAVPALLWNRVKWLFEGTFLIWIALYAAATVVGAVVFGSLLIDRIRLTPISVFRMAVLTGAVLSFAYTLPSMVKVLRGVDPSYGIYLYHMLVIFTLGYAGIKGHWWLWPLVISVSAGLAMISWLLVERPALALKGLWSKPRAPEPEARLAPR